MDFRGAHILSVKQFEREDIDRVFQVCRRDGTLRPPAKHF